MDYAVLRSELLDDPLGIGYAAMTNLEAANSLNELRYTRVRASMTGDEVFRQTNSAEFGALTDHKQAVWVSFCARETIDPADGANVNFVQWVFGSGSATVANLNIARMKSVSRATVLGLPGLREGDIQMARG